MKKCEAGFYWRPIDIQLTSPSNRWMTTHNARARYHDFYRRHRFAWTKRKGGWDVGSPGSKSIRSVVFGCLFFHIYLFFSHTKQQCCKNGGLSRSVSRIWNGKNLTFWKFSSKIPLKLRNQGLETCGNPGHGNGPGTLGAYWPITDRGWVADHWSPPRCHGFTPWVRRIG